MAKTVPYKYKAKILRWIDGDTAEVLLDLGLTVSLTLRIRLYGINTAEVNSSDPVQRVKAKEALEFNRHWAAEGNDVLVETHKPDKYGRWLGVFHKLAVNEAAEVENEKSLNMLLIEAGLATAYYGVGEKPLVQ